MKKEYLVETYEKSLANAFYIIVSTQVAKKIKKPLFIGFFDKSDEEKIMKEILPQEILINYSSLKK